MNVIGIIPARYASTRFPGKPLAMIDGKSMIRRVYEQCIKCTGLSRVVVATDNEAILAHVHDFGGEGIMTSGHHPSGTDRCQEGVEKLYFSQDLSGPEAVINIQGDEPFIEPAQISEVIRAFHDPMVMITTLARKISSSADLSDPNVVKVVFDARHQALYFSRSPIPYLRNIPVGNWLQHGTFFRHVGIYGYRTEVLRKLVKLPPTPLEKAESLEQLRWLEAGVPITVGETAYDSVSIDTPQDLLKITNTKTATQR